MSAPIDSFLISVFLETYEKYYEPFKLTQCQNFDNIYLYKRKVLGLFGERLNGFTEIYNRMIARDRNCVDCKDKISCR